MSGLEIGMVVGAATLAYLFVAGLAFGATGARVWGDDEAATVASVFWPLTTVGLAIRWVVRAGMRAGSRATANKPNLPAARVVKDDR